MTMILLEKATGLAINPADISSMRINHGRKPSTLEIALRTGMLVQVEHRPHTHDGANIYQLHQRLLEAT